MKRPSYFVQFHHGAFSTENVLLWFNECTKAGPAELVGNPIKDYIKLFISSLIISNFTMEFKPSRMWKYILSLNSFRPPYGVGIPFFERMTILHVGTRHCQKPLGRWKGFNIFITVWFTKIRFLYDVDKTVGMTKSRAFATKS